MQEPLLKLYAELVEQREELVREHDRLVDEREQRDKQANVYRAYPPHTEGRLLREIRWREEQVIALLGGIIHKEYSS